jgi:4'-phosphopantetheinyl transferase
MNANPQSSTLPTELAKLLGVDVVQVWQFSTTPELVAASTPLLSADERERMSRIRAIQARDEFVVARATLRALLGAVLGERPGSLAFTTGVAGKLALMGSGVGIHFNVAHSHGCILIALCRSAGIGVDVERTNRDIEALEIAHSSFAAQERRAIEAANEGDARTQVFYRIWTRKEAVVKAHGQGLSIPLDSFAVSAEAAKQTVTLHPAGETYFVSALETNDKNFMAALAVVAIDLPVQIIAPTQSALIEVLHKATR